MSFLDRLLRRRTPVVAGRLLDCRAVGRVLQQVLDGESDDLVADEVAAHLEACLVCGLEADTYLRIKESLLSEGAIDRSAADRLRDFGRALADGRLDDALERDRPRGDDDA